MAVVAVVVTQVSRVRCVMPNWRLKAYPQWLLSKLPYGEEVNYAMQRLRDKLGIGGPGVISRIRRRIPYVGKSLCRLREHVSLEGAEVVEIGTGWAPFVTLLLYLCGSRRIVTYDVARHCRFPIAREMLAAFREHAPEYATSLGVERDTFEERLKRIEGARDLNELFARANIEYHAPADAALSGLPESSIDLYMSYSVFEYVPAPQLTAICKEAARILRPSGRLYAYMYCADAAFAGFDKKIHRLDYLQFDEEQWRRRGMNGLYYYNRFREQELIELLEKCGGHVEVLRRTMTEDDVEHVKRMKLSDRFARLTPEQCAVTQTEMVASFPRS